MALNQPQPGVRQSRPLTWKVGDRWGPRAPILTSSSSPLSVADFIAADPNMQMIQWAAGGGGGLKAAFLATQAREHRFSAHTFQSFRGTLVVNPSFPTPNEERGCQATTQRFQRRALCSGSKVTSPVFLSTCPDQSAGPSGSHFGCWMGGITCWKPCCPCLIEVPPS